MLKRLTMRNFMCFAGEYSVEFNGRTTQIAAKNGKGKTSIATAILWALFNCDYELKSNPPVRNNSVSDKSDVEVELLIDDTLFRKVQKRKRDEKDPAKYADTNSYFVNDVPCSMKVYNERIGDIKTMLMGCNINAFLAEKADTLRAYLFEKIKNVTDEDIAKNDPELSCLAELLAKYKTDEIRALNRKVVTDADKMAQVLEGQIKEKERDIAIASDVDVAELELKRNAIKDEIAEVSARIDDNEKLLTERRKMSDGILELKFQLSDMERKAKADTDIKINALEEQRRNAEKNLERLVHDNESHKQERELRKADVERSFKRLKEFQTKWAEEKDRVFDESSLICPYCGQEYPEDKKESMRSDFETHKKDELSRITADGEAENAKVKENKKQLEEIEKLLEEDAKEIDDARKMIAELQEQISSIQPIDIKQTEEYKALQSNIAEKEKAMSGEFSAENVRQELKIKLSELQEEKERISEQIAKSDTEDYEKRLEELLAESRGLEQKKADAQKILDMLDTLEKRKNDELTDEVNKLFGLVKFQLYEFNKSGGYKNVCIPTVDGKSLMDGNANKALKMLGKIDICNTIQRLEGIDAPIILDDGESFDSYSMSKLSDLTDRQLIVLKVSDSEKLEVTKI